MVAFGAREIAPFVAQVLTKKQLEIFFAINNFQNLTFSKTVKELSKTYPQSTAKHVLKHLRKLGLVEFENGQPIKLTELGRLAGGKND